MKILHILYSGLGGHGNVFFSMVEADAKKEYCFEALFTGVEAVREEYINRCVKNNIPFTYLNKIPGKKHLSFFYSVFKSILKSDADIIFIHGSMLLLPVWLAQKIGFSNKKIIVRETQATHLKTTREKAALKVAMKLADKIVFLSEEYKEQIKVEFGKKYKPIKIAVIPNGIDLNIFKPDNNLRDPEKIVIGMQSRIVPIKDHKTLIKAFALLLDKYPAKNIILKLAGDGESKAALENQVEELKLTNKVLFVGLLPETSLPKFLNSLDIYIHASFGETMSTAIMQAMACGKAIIASDVDGINNMITDGEDGILVKAKSEKILVEKIFLLIENCELKTKLEINAHKKAQLAFNNTRMFNSYKNIFDTKRVNNMDNHL